MSTIPAEVASRLNSLIETCKDGEEGYRAAAEAVKNQDLKVMFSSLSIQRHQFAQELQEMVRALDATPENDGSTAGAMHRGWIRLRSALTNGDEAPILAECERGEEAAVAEYREVLDQEDLHGELHDLLRLQLMGVQGAYDHVREVRAHF